MTRKDYVAFANELGEALAYPSDDEDKYGYREGILVAAHAIARVCKRNNGAFRTDQFINAVNYRAKTGKLVRIGQTNFDVSS